MLEFLLALLTTATVAALLVPLLRPRLAATDRLDNDTAVYRDQLAEVERERVGCGARARVHENGRAGPLGPVDAERRKESRHRASVPDVHALAAAVEAEAEAPAE